METALDPPRESRVDVVEDALCETGRFDFAKRADKSKGDVDRFVSTSCFIGIGEVDWTEHTCRDGEAPELCVLPSRGWAWVLLLSLIHI